MSTETLSKSESTAVVNNLKTLLADSYALMGQTHVAHWNVEGPAFFQLHTAFRLNMRSFLRRWTRLLSACAPSMSCPQAALRTLADLSTISEIGIEQIPPRTTSPTSSSHNEIVVNAATAVRDSAGASEDLETRIWPSAHPVHEKTLWMLKSFLKNL